MTERFDATRRVTGERYSREAYVHLLAHLMSLEAEAEVVSGQVIERRSHLPLLSHRKCPIAFERPTSGEDWYSVRFLWH